MMALITTGCGGLSAPEIKESEGAGTGRDHSLDTGVGHPAPSRVDQRVAIYILEWPLNAV